MTARELIKQLEMCDLDKDVAVVVTIVGEDQLSINLLLREIKSVIENENIIGLQ